jgi:geranyl-CoA carboxylase alpha subunit
VRAALHAEERAVLVEAAVAALHGAAGAALPCAFARPVKLRHRGELLGLAMRERGPSVEVEIDGEARIVQAADAVAVPLAAGRWHVQVGAVDLMLEDASFDPPAAGAALAADELRAPFNGKVIAVAAEHGRAVVRGETLLVIESMKLEHALAAPRDGLVASVHVAAGQQVAAGQRLVTFEGAPRADGQSAP